MRIEFSGLADRLKSHKLAIANYPHKRSIAGTDRKIRFYGKMRSWE
ncbi:hypothetical protein QUB68_11700 [Microcoleus sp. A006_D1]